MIGTTERFQVTGQSNDMYVYSSNKLNFYKIFDKSTIQSITPASMDEVYRHVVQKKRFPDDITQVGSTVLWVADPLDAEKYRLESSYKKIQDVEGYFITIGLPNIMYSLDCSFDFTNKKIGYLDASSNYLIQAITNGYRIPRNSVLPVEIPMEKWSNLRDTLNGDVDMIVGYIVPDSPLHFILKSQPLSIGGWGKIDIDRIKLFYPYVAKTEIILKAMFVDSERGTKTFVMDKEKTGPVLKMNTPVFNIGKGTKSKETFVTRLDITPEAIDPSYRCYGDLTIEQKALCDSPFTPYGEPKKQITRWDRPCVVNEDCPFYKANKRYSNNRGGCLRGGICEMPVGVLRTAFRLYEDSERYAPFCYGCTDPQDTECCKKQKKPDYAFPNDYDDRRRAKVATFVSMN